VDAGVKVLVVAKVKAGELTRGKLRPEGLCGCFGALKKVSGPCGRFMGDGWGLERNCRVGGG